MNPTISQKLREFFEVEEEMKFEKIKKLSRPQVVQGPLTFENHLANELLNVKREIQLFHDKFQVFSYWFQNRKTKPKAKNRIKSTITVQEIEVIDISLDDETEFEGMPILYPEISLSSCKEIPDDDSDESDKPPTLTSIYGEKAPSVISVIDLTILSAPERIKSPSLDIQKSIPCIHNSLPVPDVQNLTDIEKPSMLCIENPEIGKILPDHEPQNYPPDHQNLQPDLQNLQPGLQNYLPDFHSYLTDIQNSLPELDQNLSERLTEEFEYPTLSNIELNYVDDEQMEIEFREALELINAVNPPTLNEELTSLAQLCLESSQNFDDRSEDSF